MGRTAKTGSAVVVVCASLLALAVSASPALASRGRVLGGSFASGGSGDGQLSLHSIIKEGRGHIPGSGLAVNEATHDVYVADTGNRRVDEFSSSGVFIRAWGANVGGAGVNVCTSGCVAGTSGLTPGAFEAPAFVAVDNSTGSSKGDVYVADTEETLVSKFDAEGDLIASWGDNGPLETPDGQLNGPPGEHFGGHEQYLTGLAVDASGDLWVSDHRGPRPMFEFDQSGGFIQSWGINTGETTGAGFVVDSSKDLTIAAGSGGGSVLEKRSSTGTSLGAVHSSGELPTGLAIDPVTGELFLDAGGSSIDGIASCDPSLGPCALVESFGAELSGGVGLAVDPKPVGAEGDVVYAADTATNSVDAFIPEPPGAPTVEAGSESVSNVTGDSATFSAEVNPRSEPNEGPTYYAFEYGPCATPATCASSPYESSLPIPDGQIAPSYEPDPVIEHAQGLRPHTVYHYRVAAHNSHLGVTHGEELTFTTQTPGGELVLPDGRAWELVSPPDKLGASIEPIQETGVIQAAAGGGAITYLTNTPTEMGPRGAANEVQVLSTRGLEGWGSRDIAIPHDSPTGKPVGPGQEYRLFSEDLSRGVVQPFGSFVPELSVEASEQTAYLTTLDASCGDSCYRPLVTGESGYANVPSGTVFGGEKECLVIICGPEFKGATGDLSHIVLWSKTPLTFGAGEEQLYEWGNGTLAPVSVLPDGEPAPRGRALLGSDDIAARRAISADGSRVVWKSSESTLTTLYMRDMSRGETVQLDAAEPECVSERKCASGGGVFQIASVDGSKVFFTDSHRLTGDAGESGKADLYECEMAVTAGKLKCELSDLTPLIAGESASVQEGVLGASEDGSWVYFVANGTLGSTSGAVRGTCGVSSPERCNLYVRHGGGPAKLVTVLSGMDRHDWAGSLSASPVRVSPDGEWLEFMSQVSLTGYDNRDAVNGRPDAEVFLYDASAGRVVCASCNPTGARPLGREYFQLEPGSGGLVGGPRDIWGSSDWVAANVPGWIQIAGGGQQKARYQPRYLSDGGRLFFDSNDVLVPRDVNGTEDVYQYEPPGVGGCTSGSVTFSERSDGCVDLISSGGSGGESAFLDASENGSDVFFLTFSKLASQDYDASIDVYDARECAGGPRCFAAAAVAPPACSTGDACKASPSPQPAIFGAPASATFSGAGNVPPAGSVSVVRPRSLTRARKLADALKACHKKDGKKRSVCEKRARVRFGPLKDGRAVSKRKGKG